MKPEFTAYQNRRMPAFACAECHVGPGASGFLKAKLNGVHQLYCTLDRRLSAAYQDARQKPAPYPEHV